MKIKYTKHAKKKFVSDKSAIKLGIKRKHVRQVLKEPAIIHIQQAGVNLAIGALDKSHSLCIAFKKTGNDVLVITFFPAEKGRYEA